MILLKFCHLSACYMTHLSCQPFFLIINLQFYCFFLHLNFCLFSYNLYFVNVFDAMSYSPDVTNFFAP
uniref:Uncharacterized protein n=1 Tax=Arundo donax TaxID=35708 RepID=A0A0A9DBD5_ARUDO